MAVTMTTAEIENRLAPIQSLFMGAPPGALCQGAVVAESPTRRRCNINNIIYYIVLYVNGSIMQGPVRGGWLCGTT